jgi:tRNA (cytidine/uridine-2'-O-)-methyltransferase
LPARRGVKESDLAEIRQRSPDGSHGRRDLSARRRSGYAPPGAADARRHLHTMTHPTLPPPLRAQARDRTFHVVLVEPEIPPNTGNIARLCGATRAALHLVGTLGFRIDDHAVRRAGLDYWHLVDVRQHESLAAAEAALGRGTAPAGPRSWLFSAHSRQSYLDVRFAPGDLLVFGRESVGLPTALLEERPADVVAIPTLGMVRSLNLSNAVAIALYEALRQIGALAVDPSR